ncbi:MAG: hypothetical protein AAF696_05035 [Bacteroidota bacterium]
MKRQLIRIFFLFLLSTSCIDGKSPILALDPYEEHTTELQNVVYRNKLSFGLGTSEYIPLEKYGYKDPCFNPNNPYQIAYIRRRQDSIFGCKYELHTFDFETGISRKLSNNACAYSAWSKKAWIAFWGTDYYIWKVKPNGDSLQRLSTYPSAQSLFDWSPDGSKLLGQQGQTAYVFDLNGQILFRSNEYYVPMNWVDIDNILVGWAPRGLGIAVLNIHSRDFKQVFYSSISRSLFHNPLQMETYSVNPTEPEKYLVKIDILNSKIDTIKKIYSSFRPARGDYHPKTNKAILAYHIYNIKDSLRDQLYFRNQLVLYDLASGKEMQVVLPE